MKPTIKAAAYLLLPAAVVVAASVALDRPINPEKTQKAYEEAIIEFYDGVHAGVAPPYFDTDQSKAILTQWVEQGLFIRYELADDDSFVSIITGPAWCEMPAKGQLLTLRTAYRIWGDLHPEMVVYLSNGSGSIEGMMQASNGFIYNALGDPCAFAREVTEERLSPPTTIMMKTGSEELTSINQESKMTTAEIALQNELNARKAPDKVKPPTADDIYLHRFLEAHPKNMSEHPEVYLDTSQNDYRAGLIAYWESMQYIGKHYYGKVVFIEIGPNWCDVEPEKHEEIIRNVLLYHSSRNQVSPAAWLIYPGDADADIPLINYKGSTAQILKDYPCF